MGRLCASGASGSIIMTCAGILAGMESSPNRAERFSFTKAANRGMSAGTSINTSSRRLASGGCGWGAGAVVGLSVGSGNTSESASGSTSAIGPLSWELSSSLRARARAMSSRGIPASSSRSISG